MRSFRHRRGRITFEILGALLLGSIAGANWADGRSTSSLIAASGLTLYALYRSVMLFARNPALAYGERGVRVGRLLKVSDYRWDQVRENRETVWKRPYIPFMHWLPMERHYLELQAVDSAVPIKIRVDMMELPPDGVKQVIDGFREAQVAALGHRGAAMARLGASSSEQSRAPVSGVQAERLQRLGLGSTDAEGEAAAAQPEPSAPQRQFNLPPQPVFGRKVS